MPEVKKNVVLIEHTPNPQRTIALSAKLCYSPSDIKDLEGAISEEEASKFVKKLLDLGHQSPVEHVSFTFGIEGISRACTHQLVRHRIASYSQQSQRYVRADENFNFIVPPNVKKAGFEDWFVGRMNQYAADYQYLVKALGDAGQGSNEDARFLLPNAAETKIIVTMNARELMHFFRVRCCNRAQWEIRDVAKDMYKLALNVLPQVFRHAGPACYSKGSCSEGKMSCGKADEVREEFRSYAPQITV